MRVAAQVKERPRGGPLVPLTRKPRQRTKDPFYLALSASDERPSQWGPVNLVRDESQQP